MEFGEYQIKSCMYRLDIQFLVSFISSDLENISSTWMHWAAGCIIQYLPLSEQSFSYTRRRCLGLPHWLEREKEIFTFPPLVQTRSEWINLVRHVKYIGSWKELGLRYRNRIRLWRVCSLFPSLSSWFIHWLLGKLVCHVVQIQMKPMYFPDCSGYPLSENLQNF